MPLPWCRCCGRVHWRASALSAAPIIAAPLCAALPPPSAPPRAPATHLGAPHSCPPACRPSAFQVPDISVADAQKNLKKSLEKGILKILSKMGISLLSCYHGAQIFEAYGLGRDVIDTSFVGSVSRIGGMSVADLQREAESFWAKVRGRARARARVRWVRCCLCCAAAALLRHALAHL